MRALYVALVTVLTIAPFSARAQARPRPADPVFGVDKVKHFFIVGFVESMSFASLQAAGSSRSTAKTGAIAAAAIVSFGREIHDRRTKGLFSVRDLVWDAIGASAALIVINKTQK